MYAVGINVALIHGVSGEDYLWLFALVLVIFSLAMNTSWLRYGKVGGLATPWLNYLGITVVAACALCIVLRILPEFVFGASFLVMITAPLMATAEK